MDKRIKGREIMTDEEYVVMRALEDKYTKPLTLCDVARAFGDCRHIAKRLVFCMESSGDVGYPYDYLVRYLIMTRFLLSSSGRISNDDINNVKMIPIKNLHDFSKCRETLNRVQAFCPFHNEKIPSFFIYKETNSFHCFSCQQYPLSILPHMFFHPCNTSLRILQN